MYAEDGGGVEEEQEIEGTNFKKKKRERWKGRRR